MLRGRLGQTSPLRRLEWRQREQAEMDLNRSRSVV